MSGLAGDAVDGAGVVDAAGVVRVSPVLVRLARAEVERHHREGTEAPLGVVKIAQARIVYGAATARRVATSTLTSNGGVR